MATHRECTIDDIQRANTTKTLSFYILIRYMKNNLSHFRRTPIWLNFSSNQCSILRGINLCAYPYSSDKRSHKLLDRSENTAYVQIFFIFLLFSPSGEIKGSHGLRFYSSSIDRLRRPTSLIAHFPYSRHWGNALIQDWVETLQEWFETRYSFLVFPSVIGLDDGVKLRCCSSSK